MLARPYPRGSIPRRYVLSRHALLHVLTELLFQPEQSFVNIGDPDGDLNGYQRFLVHQLVKNEFPGYRSFARGQQSFIQVEKIDPKKEASVSTANELDPSPLPIMRS